VRFKRRQDSGKRICRGRQLQLLGQDTQKGHCFVLVSGYVC